MTTRESFRPRLRIRERSPELVGFAAVTVRAGSGRVDTTLVAGGVAIVGPVASAMTGCAAEPGWSAGRTETGAETAADFGNSGAVTGCVVEVIEMARGGVTEA